MEVKRLIAIAFAILFIFAVIASVANAESTIGTISIPSINCKFDLAWFSSSANAHQHIAMLYKTYGCQTVGNHYNSHSESGGFWRLENVKVGDTAHLEYSTGNGTKIEWHIADYVCYAVFLAEVDGMNFYHNGKEVRPYEETDLICCTCVGSDSTRNYVAFFERVS